MGPGTPSARRHPRQKFLLARRPCPLSLDKRTSRKSWRSNVHWQSMVSMEAHANKVQTPDTRQDDTTRQWHIQPLRHRFDHTRHPAKQAHGRNASRARATTMGSPNILSGPRLHQCDRRNSRNLQNNTQTNADSRLVHRQCTECFQNVPPIPITRATYPGRVTSSCWA